MKSAWLPFRKVRHQLDLSILRHEQVFYCLNVNFETADRYLSIWEARGTFFNLIKDHSDWSGNNTFVLASALHSIGLAWPRLTIIENARIKPIKCALNNLRDLFKNFFLPITIREYAVIPKLLNFLLIIFVTCSYSNQLPAPKVDDILDMPRIFFVNLWR